MKIADPDGADKETVLRIVADVGSSRLMPATSRPGVCLSSKGYGRDFAFVIARRQDAANRTSTPRVRVVHPHPQEAE
jgi:hypothetical protein